MTMRKHDVLRELIVTIVVTAFVIAALYVSCGCDLACDTAAVKTGDTIKPKTEVEVEPEVITENVDKSDQRFKDIEGDITVMKKTVSTNTSNISTNTSNISTETNNGIPFWQLAVAVIGLIVLYLLWEYLKYNVYRKKKEA